LAELLNKSKCFIEAKTQPETKGKANAAAGKTAQTATIFARIPGKNKQDQPKT